MANRLAVPSNASDGLDGEPEELPMWIRALAIAALLAILVRAEPLAAQEDEQPVTSETAPTDRPPTTPGADDCRPAQMVAAPGAIVVVPGTDCPVDITDPNFRPFALPNQ